MFNLIFKIESSTSTNFSFYNLNLENPFTSAFCKLMQQNPIVIFDIILFGTICFKRYQVARQYTSLHNHNTEGLKPLEPPTAVTTEWKTKERLVLLSSVDTWVHIVIWSLVNFDKQLFFQLANSTILTTGSPH